MDQCHKQKGLVVVKEEHDVKEEKKAENLEEKVENLEEVGEKKEKVENLEERKEELEDVVKFFAIPFFYRFSIFTKIYYVIKII